MLISIKGDINFGCYFENGELVALCHESVLSQATNEEYVVMGDNILEANAENQFITPIGVKFGLTVRSSELTFQKKALLALGNFRGLGTTYSYELTDFGNCHQLILRYIAYAKILHINCDYELSSLDAMVVKQFQSRAPRLV